MSTVKRQKVEEKVINENVLTKEYMEQLRDSIRNSEPYKHGVIHKLFNDKILRSARDEIMENIHFTTKETDIYKVNQTGDLANLQRLDSNERELLKNLGKIRDAIYSKEFRDFMSFTTDCGPLSGSKQDLSINLYNKGCHLLNHDDVIGTRKVSYIVYLTPPDDPWQPKWGGGLRLFSTVKPGIPETDFSVVIPPQWNQMSYFKVQPGHSFHDVEENYVDKDRLSISGWFHVPQEGEPGYSEEKDEDLDKATLAQLESLTQDEAFEPKLSLAPLAAESNDEKAIAYLSKYIKKSVLDNLESLNEQFCAESMIQIAEFLEPEFHKKVADAIEIDDLAKVPKNSSQVAVPWKVAKPPHMHGYMYIDDNSDEKIEPCSSLAAHSVLGEIRRVFASSEFLWFLQKLTGLDVISCQSIARRFRPGHDFTLATSSGKKENVLEATLCLTTSVWNDDVGGYDLIMAPDDADDADPAVYRAGGDSAVLLTAMPAANEFILVYREPNLLRFIKYLSRNATGSRWDVNANYGLNELEDDEQEDDKTSPELN